MKVMFLIGWGLLALEAIGVISLVIVKNAGDDAAGQGVARGWGPVLVPFLLIAGGLLYWGQSSSSKPFQWTALLFVAIPFLIGGGLWTSNELENARHRRVLEQAGQFSDSQLTALARAIDRKDWAALRAMPKQIDWTARDGWEATLLGHAIRSVLADYTGDASVEGVRILLAHGAPLVDGVMRPNERLMATVFEANTPGAALLLQTLLEAGADANARTSDGLPLIHITNQGLEKVKLLVAHGADLKALNNRPDRRQWTALMNAAYMQDWPLATYFLEQGISPAYQAPDGKTLALILKERAESYQSYGEEPPPGYLRFVSDVNRRQR